VPCSRLPDADDLRFHAIALTLRRDLEEVAALLETAAAGEPLEEARRVWTYVPLRALRLRWSSLPDPMYELEDAIERFGEPDPYYDFLPYLPPGELKSRCGRLRYLDALDAQLRLDAQLYGWADPL